MIKIKTSNDPIRYVIQNSTNYVNTVLTLNATEANTKMVYASNKSPTINFSPASPCTINSIGGIVYYGRNAASPTTLTPGGNWSGAGPYTFPIHPGWLVVRDGVLYINSNNRLDEMTIDDLNRGSSDSINPGTYNGCYFQFNKGEALNNSGDELSALAIDSNGSRYGTVITNIGFGNSPYTKPSSEPSAANFSIISTEQNIYPVKYNADYQISTGTVERRGSIFIYSPKDCHYALEYIWIPLISAVGGEQAWRNYTWYDMYNAGYRFNAVSWDGNSSKGWTYNNYLLDGSSYPTYKTGHSGNHNAIAWRLLVQPRANDTRCSISYARVMASVSRTNTDGSQFMAKYNNGAWSSDIGNEGNETNQVCPNLVQIS